MNLCLKRLAPLLLIPLHLHALERIGSIFATIPSKTIQSLNLSERTCADRALKALDAGSPRTAANELKRFETEFLETAPDESQDWALTLRAYALDRARDTNQAIDLWKEVIDRAPDTQPALAALYFLGRAHRANGKIDPALTAWRDLLCSPEAKTSPYAAPACNAIADIELQRGNLAPALDAWRTAQTLDPKSNPDSIQAAQSSLSIIQAYDNFLQAIEQAKGPDTLPINQRRQRLKHYFDQHAIRLMDLHPIAQAYLKTQPAAKKDPRAAARQKADRDLTTYLRAAAPLYTDDNAKWELLLQTYDYLSWIRPSDLPALAKRLPDLLAKAPTPETKSARALDLIHRFRRHGRLTDAKLLLPHIANPEQRAWTAADLAWQERNPKDIYLALQPLEASPDPQVAARAKRNHAEAARQIEGDYPTAIRLFQEAPDLPATLWAIADCHRRAGNKTAAQATLDEIASVFPKDAPEAVLRKGDWFRDDGNKKNAIACYRRLMTHPDWKKSPQSSQAHQRLEAYGIATGGAVLNETR
ncbi:MAG: tol-pal system YbgF family protein [Kiritimatiellia bacterium]